MSRATLLLMLLVVTLALPLAARRALAAEDQINGIGLVDYRHKPDFKVGDWVKYRISGKSEMGFKDDYEVTVLIAGEEDFWGDPCFWVETWTEGKSRSQQTQAALMSYEVFRDPLAIERLMFYLRKQISMLNDDGTPNAVVNKPSASTLKTRREVKKPLSYDIDTLGTEQLTFEFGTFEGTKTLRREGKGVTQAVGDSTRYTEWRDDRTSWWSPRIPITHLLREDIETGSSSKAWLIGRSGDAGEMNLRDRALARAELIGFGHGGLEARFVAKRYRRSLAEQRAAERTSTAKPPARR
jgi:hypothetical protein